MDNLKIALMLLMSAGLLVNGCREKPTVAPAIIDPALVSGTQALAEVREFIALGRRDAGTAGAQKVADYLLARLKQLGVTNSVIDAFDEEYPGGRATFRNVLGTIRGAGNRWIILGSHFDTKSGISDAFQGANDSGSSTGLLLELGRGLSQQKNLPFNILLAFFDGEECRRQYGPQDGLHGSRRLARQLQQDGRATNVQAVIILDMIGDRDLSVTLPRNGAPALMTAVFKAAETAGVRDKFSLAANAVLDDHQPFLDAGLPAVDVIDFQYGSAPGQNDYWHTPEDTLDKLSADSLALVGRVVIRVVNDITQSH